MSADLTTTTEARLPLTTTKHTEADLDRAVDDVERLKADAAVTWHALGTRIAEIEDAGLWKLRADVDPSTGKARVRFRSFKQFVESELLMSIRSAQNLAEIARNFDDADVKAFGTAKLGLFLQAPVEDRPRLQQAATNGASTRAIAKELRATNGKRASVARTARATQAAKDRASQIVVARLLGSQTVRLIKKPARLPAPDDAPRARKLSDEPYGCLQFAPGVTEHFFITSDASGGLVLRIKTVRDDLESSTSESGITRASKPDKASTSPTTKPESREPQLDAPRRRNGLQKRSDALASPEQSPSLPAPVVSRAYRATDSGPSSTTPTSEGTS